jgi:hypothetical protein
MHWEVVEWDICLQFFTVELNYARYEPVCSN